LPLDFTSALYLGLHHSSASVGTWTQLTTGAPAVLKAPPGGDAVAAALADLQGCEAALLAPSTLHLFWDLFGVLAERGVAVYADAGLYAIGRWGVERAAARGVPARMFPHFDAHGLSDLLAQRPHPVRRPIIVTDGYCTGCGQAAPLPALLTLARRAHGLLVVDDTQALGVLGTRPSGNHKFGRGGGGSLRWHSTHGSEVLLISSLAKGFGVPLGAIAGTHTMMRRFATGSETRVHCSPPSVLAIRAAEEALRINRERGDMLRRQLAALVHRFRSPLERSGIRLTGELFPVQSIVGEHGLDMPTVHQRLSRAGVLGVLRRTCSGRSAISFLLSARHSTSDIERAANLIRLVLAERMVMT
jgi:8-amino-7-oxononanoate synthase